MTRLASTAGAMVIAVALGVAGSALKPDGDRYLWLSDIRGAKALAWVKLQNKKSGAVLKNTQTYRQDYASILGALNSSDRIPLGRLEHGEVYNFWQDAKHVRGIWRRTTVADFGNAEPNWELLLDVDALDAKEHTPFVWQGEDCAPGAVRCLIRLSPGGGDATTVREFDRTTKSFLSNGFALSLSKLNAAYLDADTVLFGTNFGPGTMTRSSYPRIVKLWHRGAPVSAARTVYEASQSDVAARPIVFHGPYGTIALIDHALTFFTSEYFFLRPDRTLLKLPLPLSANLEGVTQGNLIFTLRDAWKAPGTATTFAPGSMIAFPVAQFVAGKPPRFELLMTPDPRSMIDNVMTGRDAIYASVFTNVIGAVHEFRHAGNGNWSDTTLALPGGGSTNVVAADEWGPEAEFSFESFLSPPTLYAYDDKRAPAAIKSQTAVFDASDLTADQFWATSRDGTKIPYFLVRAKNAHGPLPTILYAYGGFQLSLTPWYWNDGHRPLYPGAPWLERGGAIAVANIRGGGEFGPAWHTGVLKYNRRRVFEDFEAVAANLEQHGVTRPEELGIVGASNGGLLVSTAMTQRPDLFRAVVCQRPLIDMLRYTRFGAGASWVDEYGDPSDAKMRTYISGYSPYQNIAADKKYPSVLFITETSDDRVTPVFARMMAAKMEDQGHDVLFSESTEGGHGPGATNAAQAEMWSLSYVYLSRELGLEKGLKP